MVERWWNSVLLLLLHTLVSQKTWNVKGPANVLCSIVQWIDDNEKVKFEALTRNNEHTKLYQITYVRSKASDNQFVETYILLILKRNPPMQFFN